MAKESQKRLLTKEECVNKNYLKYIWEELRAHEILTKGYKLFCWGFFDRKTDFFFLNKIGFELIYLLPF